MVPSSVAGSETNGSGVVTLKVSAKFGSHRKAEQSGWLWKLKLNFTKYCIQSTLREKLQDTANLYIRQAGFKHFGAKSEFEQKSFPPGRQ